MLTRRTILQGAAASAVALNVPSVFASSPSFDMKKFAAEVAELVAIDSPSGHEAGVNKVIDIMAKKFQSIGWTVSQHYCKGRGNALVATSGKNQDHYDVVLCAHADTVQPVGNAKKYPFKLDGTVAHGAGVGDDKSSLNFVYWICKDLPKSTTDNLNIAVIINPGEESGSPATIQFMAEQAKKTPIALVYEPGRGEVKGGAFVKVRKGCIFLTIKFHGVPAHAGNNPEQGRNAITAMALAIPQISAIAKKYPNVTLNGDVVKGGTTPNTIAAEAEVVFDFRFMDNQVRDAVLKDIRTLCSKEFVPGVKCEVVQPNLNSALAHNEQSKKLVALVNKAASELGQPQPNWLVVGGASDGNKFSATGAAVACAMGVVSGNLHDPQKEWSDLSTAPTRLALGQKILAKLAAQKGKL